MPFLIRGLALPASPFFCGLLDFNSLNLTHLNPNSVLQIVVFVHLCEAFLGIFHILACGSTFTIVSLEWLGGSISWSEVPVWSFAEVGKLNNLTFH